MKGPFPLSPLTPTTNLHRAAIIQRVLSASVTVDKEVVSSIGKGVLVLAAVAAGDTEKEADTLANKVLRLKLWGDDNGGMVGDPPGAAGAYEAAVAN